MYGATKQIVETCTQQADYRISEQDRKNGTIPTTADGEEIGTGGGIWHDGTFASK